MRLPGRARYVWPMAALMAGLALVVSLGSIGAVAKKNGAGKQPRGPYPTLGCQIFPSPLGAIPNGPAAGDQSAWNQDISGSPVDPNSAAYIAYINSHGGTMLHPDFGSPREYGFPYSVTGPKQKRRSVKFTAYGSESTHGKYRIPSKALVEGGQGSDGDRHVISIDGKTCRLHELYRAFPRKGKQLGRWSADSGVIWDLGSAALRTPGFTSADAAGLPIFPGLVRFEEAAAGGVNHAIRVTFSETQKAYINPASHCASDVTNANAPPTGLRLRLNSAYNTSGLTGPALAIAVAMKRYGLIVADNGSSWFVSGTSDRRWDDGNLNQLKTIPGSAFEVVQSAAPVQPC